MGACCQTMQTPGPARISWMFARAQLGGASENARVEVDLTWRADGRLNGGPLYSIHTG
jgi:Na+/alanine symporter